MLLSYALEERSPWFALAFAIASWASAPYAQLYPLVALAEEQLAP